MSRLTHAARAGYSCASAAGSGAAARAWWQVVEGKRHQKPPRTTGLRQRRWLQLAVIKSLDDFVAAATWMSYLSAWRPRSYTCSRSMHAS